VATVLALVEVVEKGCWEEMAAKSKVEVVLAADLTVGE
jgi:hypothetical protein